ncbi:hypothetical protein F5Y17DRAFT_434907 [Xylariaceae sp. FL0594]|nr:hypothetical protein F5Y17DRAFT_434907 [Xylariaceae sp. FL0594]
METSTTAQPRVQDSPLVKALSPVLPKDLHYTAWHLSTVPSKTEALYYSPALKPTGPDAEPRATRLLTTYCEKHFLAVSIPDPATQQDVIFLGLEIYIYTTTYTTTIFVSKADSTGYLYLQPSPRGHSPIKDITLAFIRFLIDHRRRASKQLVVNLFARAQSQYLFPGSVKNPKKHILDDRGLIKWWCNVVNPLVGSGSPDSITSKVDFLGYLIIPGLDSYETRAFVPRSPGSGSQVSWTVGDPLKHISPYANDQATFGDVPLRCLIPTYPDDPKARFVDDLEESTPEKAKLVSGWKTPKTLAHFWEMMAFRQECSSGRMTGFVWLVSDPPISTTTNADRPKAAPAVKPAHSKTKPLRCRKGRARTVLKGPIIPREPRIKTQRTKYPDKIETPFYSWPEAGRGQVVVNDHEYTRAVELLLHLEFKGLEQAIASTSRWVSEVNMGENWALPIVGEAVASVPAQPSSVPNGTIPGAVNNLQASIIRKRKTEDPTTVTEGPVKETAAAAPAVNMLGAGLVRKRAKVDTTEV